MDADKIQATIVSYEDLANIEDEFEEIDLEISAPPPTRRCTQNPH